MGALFHKFYHHNFWDILPSQPISCELEMNPLVKEVGWWVVYYGGFHVLVEKHFQLATGPHIAMLRYTSQQMKRAVWIATLQMECFFFSEEKIKEYMFIAIKNKSFYLNPNEAHKQIPI